MNELKKQMSEKEKTQIATITSQVQELQEKLSKQQDEHVAATYINPLENHQELVRVKEELRALKKGQDINKRALFPANGRSLQTQTGEVICANCYKVGHFQRSCLKLRRWNGWTQ